MQKHSSPDLGFVLQPYEFFFTAKNIPLLCSVPSAIFYVSQSRSFLWQVAESPLNQSPLPLVSFPIKNVAKFQFGTAKNNQESFVLRQTASKLWTAAQQITAQEPF